MSILLQLSVDKVRRDGGTQMRERLDREAVFRYVDVLRNDGDLDPVIVYKDADGAYWLADGFMRLAAHIEENKPYIMADVRHGTRRDAVLYACGANARHGLPRSHADRRRAIRALLEDPEWSKWSDRKIAEICCVDHKTVGTVRTELFPEPTGESPQATGQPVMRTFERDGQTREMDVSGLKGRTPKLPPPFDTPVIPPAPRKSSQPGWVGNAEVAMECVDEARLNLAKCPDAITRPVLMVVEKAAAAIRDLITRADE